MENEFNNQNQPINPNQAEPIFSETPPVLQSETPLIDSSADSGNQNPIAGETTVPSQTNESEFPSSIQSNQTNEISSTETSPLSEPAPSPQSNNSYQIGSVTVGGPSASQVAYNQSQNDLDKPKLNFFKRFRKLVITSGSLVVLIVLFLVFYFVYWMNPNVIYSQALSNSATGLDNLISYAKTQTNTTVKGTSLSGSLSFSSGGSKITGNLSQLSDGRNAKINLSLNLAGQNLNFNGLSIASPSGTPDLYLKLSGFSPILSSLGSSGSPYSKLDNQWIEINHTIFDQVLQTTKKTGTLTSADIITAADAVASVNQQYLFNSNPKYSVLTVVKNYGIEKINNQSTYHY